MKPIYKIRASMLIFNKLLPTVPKFYSRIFQTSVAGLPQTSLTLWLNDAVPQIFMTLRPFTWSELALANTLKENLIFAVTWIRRTKITLQMSIQNPL